MQDRQERVPKQSDEASGCFAFGKNWKSYARGLDESRIESAMESLRELLQVDDLHEKRFLDAGCGSGLLSLAAHRLGAKVTAFDLDRDSVECALDTQARFSDAADGWKIHHGSLLDDAFLSTLGKFDIVYCWGVAHHTGSMWQGLANLAGLVEPDGKLVLAIYNDEGYISRIWQAIKQTHHVLPAMLQPLWVAMIGVALWSYTFTLTAIASLLRIATLRNPWIPFRNWMKASRDRGMDGWHDLVDWVGGWPFEVAKPDAVFRFFHERNFTLQNLRTVIGHGCNEYVFLRRYDLANR